MSPEATEPAQPSPSSPPSPPSSSSSSSSSSSYDPESRGLRLVAVLLVLTVVSGLIDAVSYLGLGHVFTANMTGNVVVLGFAAAGAPGFSVPHTLTSLAAFVAGAVAGGRLSGRLGGGSRRRWARITLAVEAVFLGASSAVAFAAPDATATGYALIAVTAFAMGLRNATVRRLGVPDLTTTVLTMTLTGLAADSRAAGGTGRHSPRRSASVVAMALGAALGAWLVVRHGLGIPLLVAAVAVAALAVCASGRE
ncbi:YoaK family protein [Streptomyces sp. NRRL WC-3618]|uniref:YoaK family protein n=1 Tax=Streptomyces sp. NRRL WC-3618 TaxID=1519490 RepID=UPI001F2DF392|nr:YoaK family protein [Streptomyces sp. NRRL WC-3618]